MRRDQVLQVLAGHQAQLRKEFGVKSLALFGSVARDEAEDASDVDLLVEFDRPVGYFHIFHLQDYLERTLGGTKVDLVLRQSVIEDFREAIYGEAIHVLG